MSDGSFMIFLKTYRRWVFCYSDLNIYWQLNELQSYFIKGIFTRPLQRLEPNLSLRRTSSPPGDLELKKKKNKTKRSHYGWSCSTLMWKHFPRRKKNTSVMPCSFIMVKKNFNWTKYFWNANNAPQILLLNDALVYSSAWHLHFVRDWQPLPSFCHHFHTSYSQSKNTSSVQRA